MLKELSKYENLGTPGYHFELLKVMRDGRDESWNTNNISEHFYNRMIDGRTHFDGCLPLLHKIGVIKIASDETVSTHEPFLEYLVSEKLLIDKLVEKFLFAVNDDPLFHDMFCSEFISRDIIYHSIQIDNSAFPLKMSSFKQFLIDFGVLQEHPTKELNRFIINGRYKKLFDKFVLPEIKKRKVGIEELQKSLEQRQIFGEEAEKFVLEFENKRLNGTKIIDWVAEYSTNDGYDIASYNCENSKEHDRFIEVKSFSGSLYFFWTRNEMDIARIKKSSYYIYLVNRDEMNTPNYTPIMIEDPYTTVLKAPQSWEQRIEKIRFEIKNDR